MQEGIATCSGGTGESTDGIHAVESGKREWTLPAELWALLGTDTTAVAELVELYLSDAVKRLELLKIACQNQDFRVVRLQAHSLKGSSLQIGAKELGRLCSALELCDKPSQEDCGRILRSIQEEFAWVGLAMTGAPVAG